MKNIVCTMVLMPVLGLVAGALASADEVPKRPKEPASATTSKKPTPADSAAAAPTEADARRIVRETTRAGLAELEVPAVVAEALVKAVVDPQKSEEAKSRIEVIAGAAADLHLVSVDDAKRRAVIDTVSRSADPKATADEKVGEAATEAVFGKGVAIQVGAAAIRPSTMATRATNSTSAAMV